ncbi:MAG: BTAD domain-containing putative transcriptional regulator [Caldimonas sp.]
MMAAMLELRVLGVPMLCRGQDTIALPIRKSMALLLLVASHREGLPRSRVAGLLWPDLDESSGRRNLRRELARLRECGAGDAVRVDGDRLAAGDGLARDVDVFDRSAGEGRAEDALALWRGPPADGFSLGDSQAFDDWLEGERGRWRESRRSALLAAAAASEARGEPARALGHVEALLADDPLQEQHYRQAMRLLAACGRRETALARYEHCRELLRSELGLAPMAETEALAAMLRSERGPVASTPAAAPAAPPDPGGRPTSLPERLPFVGRGAEVAALEAAWSAGRAIVIEGAGGVGKSRLATDFAAAHGPHALARCRAGDGEVPYASFSRALRALMGPVPARPDALPEWAGAELARLIPELGSAPPPLRTDEEKNRFFEACASAWQALAAGDFDAVVVDDWHLADAASRTLFAFIMRRRHEAGSGGVREIVALRPELDAEGRAGLDALVGSTGASHLQLPALTGDEVLELVQRLSGAGAPTRFAQRLERATGGNPFFLAETLRHLTESKLLTVDASGAWQTPFDASTEDYREIPVPASVQEAVLARSRRLPLATQRVLEAAALCEEPFAPALLAPACALSELEALLAIEAAVIAGLLQEHQTGGYAFAHDLVQQALSAALSPERRRLAHRRLALGAEAAGAPPALVAAHHEASGDLPRAVAHRQAAGDQARRLGALPDAIAHWSKALADRPGASQEVALRHRLVRAAYDRTDFVAVREQAHALGRLLAAGPVLTAEEKVATSIGRALALARGGDGAGALALLDALPGEPAGRQRFDALWARAVAMEETGRTDLAAAAVQTALALPDLTDIDRVELLDFAFLCDTNSGRPKAALVHADAALALARRLGDAHGLARGRFRRGIVLLHADDAEGAAAELLAAAGDAQRLGLVHLARMALYNLTCAHATVGRHAQALAAAERGWNLSPPLAESDFRVMYRLAMVDAHFALGDLGACWRETAPAVDEAMRNDDPRVRIGAVACTLEPLGLLGEQALARRLVATVTADDTRALKGSADEMWIVIAQFELRHGDAAAAQRALASLDATGEVVLARARMRGAQARAELALLQGDAAAALALLPADDDLGMNGELRTRGLALRVAAEAARGEVSAASVAAAAATLAMQSEHAIATLELHAALAHATRAGVAGLPAGAESAYAAYAAKLATTLQDWPAQQQAFVLNGG